MKKMVVGKGSYWISKTN